MVPPIGILTRNRAAYLDVTLRSLSDTLLPDNVAVRVFDDASDCSVTREYYTEGGCVDLGYNWPVDDKWESRGFNILPTGVHPRETIGHKIDISVVQAPLGVVAASCSAVRSLFEMTGEDGVFLLQDDVVFNADWYLKMLNAVKRSKKFAPNGIGVLSGIKLNHKLRPKHGQIAVSSGITAQCLYITRRAFDTVPFLSSPPPVKMRFDDLLRRGVTNTGLWGGVIFPFVCQHIGVSSLVRPHRKWVAGKRARVGYYSSPPYAMSDTVRVFRKSSGN